MTEVIAQLLPDNPRAVLSGPNLAREIMAGYAAGAVVACRDADVARALQGVFNSGLYRVYTTHDVVGVEVAGALKNVIAIAAGMADGVGVGDNTRALVITRGLAELTRLGVAMGGEARTFAGLAGLGDLLATCMSPLSRNRHVGEQLGKGRKLDEIVGEMRMVAEGIHTCRLALELGETPRRRDADHAGDRPRRARRGHRPGGLPGPRPAPARSRERMTASEDPRAGAADCGRAQGAQSWSDQVRVLPHESTRSRLGDRPRAPFLIPKSAR